MQWLHGGRHNEGYVDTVAEFTEKKSDADFSWQFLIMPFNGHTPIFKAVLALVATAGFFLYAAAPAQADFRVCNATQNLVGVAIGYRASSGWISEGWWHVEASSCKTLIEGSLQSRYYYLYAEDATQGGRWQGEIPMCVADKEFKIAGVNDCFARGFERAGFQEYDTGQQENWMVQLTGSSPADESAALSGASNP